VIDAIKQAMGSFVSFTFSTKFLCGVNHRLIVIAVTQIQNHRQAFMQSYVAKCKYTRCPRTHAPEKKGEIFIKEQINNPNEIFFYLERYSRKEQFNSTNQSILGHPGSRNCC
jgi:hypothetical protein